MQMGCKYPFLFVVVLVAPIVYEALLLLHVSLLSRGKKMQQTATTKGKEKNKRRWICRCVLRWEGPDVWRMFSPHRKGKKHNHKVLLGRLNGRAINHDQRWESVRLFFLFYLNSRALVFFSFPLETFPAMDLLHWQSVAHTQRSLNAKCFPNSLSLLFCLRSVV